MSGFDTFVVVDWSAGKQAPARPSKNAIWIGFVRDGIEAAPVYCRNRLEAETWLEGFIAAEAQAGRRVLIGFDFPFGYPKGFVKAVTGSQDPIVFWNWLESRIVDNDLGENNRFEIASALNRIFEGSGPFWGKPNELDWPNVPYRKTGISYTQFAERRSCDLRAKTSSSCFQLFYNPTVGSQALMGLPMLSRLRRRAGCAVWPLEDWSSAQTVLAEIWPGLIETAVKEVATDPIRDRVQVQLLARALSRLGADQLAGIMADAGDTAPQEGWILGAGHDDALCAAARQPEAPKPPPLRNDCFALPPGVHWTPAAEALALLKTRMRPVCGAEKLAVGDSAGRICARDVIAQRSNPPLPNTAVDGYGFAGGRGQAEHKLPLAPGRAAAGDAVGNVAAGQAIRVLTGAALPDGVDTVVLQEDVSVQDGYIRFNGPVQTGANARKAGEDVVDGAVVVVKGRAITPADIALMVATGTGEVDVFRRLKIGVLSTGDELAEAGSTASPAQIYDANRPMLLAMVAGWGHEAVDLGRAGDDRGQLRAVLDNAVEKVDVILTSGGASAGDEDHMSALLTEAGAMALWRLAIKPGRPLALGFWQHVPVFGLPGNPVAAMVCALIFARPAVAALAGTDWPEPQGFNVPAAFAKRKKPGRREYLRARIRNGRAEVFASEGSGRISGLSWAEGLVELAEDAAEIRPGDPVRYVPWSSFGL